MDGSSFDALTRAFSNFRSRQGLAQVLLGVAPGGMPVRADLDESGAKRGIARP